MLLLIDVDSQASTGWLGYDIVVNRSAATRTSTTLQHFNAHIGDWGEPVSLACRVEGPRAGVIDSAK